MSSKRKSNKPSKPTSSNAAATTAAALEHQEAINIPIHSYLSRLQRNHGLLQHDYHQYRQYLTRRISRLRHTKIVRMYGNAFYEECKTTTAASGASKSKQNKHAFVNKKLVIPFVDENSNLDEKDKETRNKEKNEEETKQNIIIPHENFILILLLQAERAFAYGMEYKQLQQQKPSSNSSSNHNPKHLQHLTPKRRKQLFLSKFRKSISNIQKIKAMLKKHPNLATSQTLLECDAYEAYLKGNYLLEKKQWLSCYCEYHKCISLFKTLIITSNTSEEEDVFKFRIEQDLEPVLRFCKYELMEGGMTEEKISKCLENDLKASTANIDNSASSATTTTTASYTVQFRTKSISITSEGLCISLLKIDTLQKEQKEKTNKDWNALIQEYDNISELIQLEMSSSSLTQNNMSDYKILKQYILFSKLQLLLQRNEYLVQDLLTSKKQRKKQAKFEDITHVYMLLLQDARSVVSCLQDGGTDDEYFLLSQAQVIRYRALYCCSLGHCYASFITTNKSMTNNHNNNDDENSNENMNIEEYYQKAKGLYEHSLELASMAAEELSACSNTNNNIDDLVQSMVTLETEITGAKCRLEACRYLKTVRITSNHIPLLQRLNDSTLIVNNNKDATSTSTTQTSEKTSTIKNNQKPFFLVDSMPIQKYQYIPCKPTFFDLAWNYIEEMEPTKEELKKYIEELEIKEKGGSSRFLGWFYR